MAKVTGPLLSIAASGTIADTMTFASWKGIAYVRMWCKPMNPKTVEQMIQRGNFKAAVFGWHATSLSVQASWDVSAVPYQVSGFNYYVQQYLVQESYLTNVIPSIPGV